MNFGIKRPNIFVFLKVDQLVHFDIISFFNLHNFKITCKEYDVFNYFNLRGYATYCLGKLAPG